MNGNKLEHWEHQKCKHRGIGSNNKTFQCSQRKFSRRCMFICFGLLVRRNVNSSLRKLPLFVYQLDVGVVYDSLKLEMCKLTFQTNAFSHFYWSTNFHSRISPLVSNSSVSQAPKKLEIIKEIFCWYFEAIELTYTTFTFKNLFSSSFPFLIFTPSTRICFWAVSNALFGVIWHQQIKSESPKIRVKLEWPW